MNGVAYNHSLLSYGGKLRQESTEIYLITMASEINKNIGLNPMLSFGSFLNFYVWKNYNNNYFFIIYFLQNPVLHVVSLALNQSTDYVTSISESANMTFGLSDI